ncbi:MAG: ribonuclease HII [Actinobacteria bacterium]|nr:ribonuclease HII [Actinomycetota bacterium]
MIEERLLKSGLSAIAGVDEAGRGACAGPLVIAALILKDPESSALSKVRDSKELTPKAREEIFPVILENARSQSIIEISPAEIDSFGLHKSNIEGMRRAISALDITPDYVLTDGYEIPGIAIPNLAVWKGDQVALTISAASILAKVHRDRLMASLDKEYPEYGFAEHKGYVTSSHTAALERIGVSPVHRKSYANIAKLDL